MSLQVEKLEKNMAKLTIEVSAEEFEEAIQKAYLKNRGNIKTIGLLSDLFGNSNREFKIGDRVRVKYRGQEGYIIDKNSNLYTVSINNGQIVDSYEASDLEICW